MPLYRIREGQSLQDVALQLYGDASKARKIVFDNPSVILNLNDSNLTNKEIEYEETSNDTTNALNRLQRIINTSDPRSLTGGQFDDSFSDSFLT